MKKFLILAVVAVLATGTAQAKIDLVSAAQQAQNKIDSVTQANEDAKASLEIEGFNISKDEEEELIKSLVSNYKVKLLLKKRNQK